MLGASPDIASFRIRRPIRAAMPQAITLLLAALASALARGPAATASMPQQGPPSKL